MNTKKLEGKTFAVLRYNISACGVSSMMYELCFRPSEEGKDGNTLLTRDDALDIIDEFQLEAHEVEGGTVYDTPMQSFLNRYKGHYSRKQFNPN